MKDKEARGEIQEARDKIGWLIDNKANKSSLPLEFDCPTCKHKTLATKQPAWGYSFKGVSVTTVYMGTMGENPTGKMRCYSCGGLFELAGKWVKVKSTK